MRRRTWAVSVGKAFGALAAMAGVLAALFLVWVAVIPFLSVSSSGVGFVTESGLGAENAPIVLFWSIVIIAGSLLAGYGAWTERLTFVWVLAVGFVTFAVLGGFSIGPFVVPAAALLVCSAIVLTFGRFGSKSESAITA